MTDVPIATDLELKTKILAILDENRIMSVATLRPDGWPQVTMVGFIHDELALYFAIGRDSQKHVNIARDPRISIAIGQDQPDHIRGLSLAARAAEVGDFEEIQRLNVLLHASYPEQRVFAPRQASSVIIKATPSVISVIDMSKGPGPPELVEIASETTVHRPGEGERSGRFSPGSLLLP